MEDYTLDEWIEIKLSLNTQMAERIKYSMIETSKKRLEDNNIKLELDRKLIQKVINKIDNIKGDVSNEV